MQAKTFRMSLALTVLIMCIVALHAMAATVLLSNFENDGDISAWNWVGDPYHPQNFNVAPYAPGCNGDAFCIRMTMCDTTGWTGVAAPEWSTLPVTNPTALTLNARGSTGCPEILIDLYTSDSGGSSYWCIQSVTNGAWQNFQLTPSMFNIVTGTGPANPNFSHTTAIWFEIDRNGSTTDTVTLDIDDVGFTGTAVSASGTTPPALTAESCSGINVLLANTTALPSLGQTMSVDSAATSILTAAGATVTTVTPGSLNLTAAPNTVLAWEGPVCNQSDWTQVQSYLENGGAMLWWGAGLPFSTPVTSAGAIVDQPVSLNLANLNYADGLTDGWYLDTWVNGTLVPSDSTATLQLTQYDGLSALQATLSACSSNPLNYDSQLALASSWYGVGQSANFDLSQTVALTVNFVTPTTVTEGWVVTLTATFADETGSPQHTTVPKLHPGSTMIFHASDFNTTNELFASMNSLEIVLPSEAATFGQGSYQDASIGIELTGVTLSGYAKSDIVTAPATALAEGPFLIANPLQVTSSLSGSSTLQDVSYWNSTALGQSIWPGFTSSINLAPGDSYYLATNCSGTLNTQWPWVDFDPLMTIGYATTGWCGYEEAYTGSVITLFNYHSGPFAGARVILGTMASSTQSPLSPSNAMFPQMLTGCVKQLAGSVTTSAGLADLPTPPTAVTRSNYFSHPQYVLGVLDWSSNWSNPSTVYGIQRLGLNVDCAEIPWLPVPDENGTVINWAQMDQIVADAQAGGWGVVFDGYCFGYGFGWAETNSAGLTTMTESIYNPSFTGLFTQMMSMIATRYANNPAVVGLFATPDTSTLCFNCIDTTGTGIAAWDAYCTANGLSNTLPTVPNSGGSLDLTQARVNYINFWSSTAQGFVGSVINAIRAAAPNMPILLRGAYLDVAQSFVLASHYTGVEPHIECTETSMDTESYFRGYSLRYGVPISAENGWPQERGAALQWACADALLGGYNDYFYSGTASSYAYPGLYDFENLTSVWPYLKGASYTTPKVGILACDSKIWASNPTSFLSCGSPSSGLFMERNGIPFVRVSCQWPLLTGLTILADDGASTVLNATARTTIVNWVKAGGTLIALTTTGKYDAAGASTTLASALGITFTAGQTKTVGSGKVMVLSGAPTDETSTYAPAYLAALESAGASCPVPINTYVNQAVFTKGANTYLVVYNKNGNLEGAMFSDIGVPAAVAAMSNQTLTITVPAGTVSATELVTGATLPISSGQVTLSLPATDWRVVEFVNSASVSISTAKQSTDGTTVGCTGVVTASVESSGYFYIEDPDRSCGIRVTGYSSAAVGDNASVEGAMGTLATGERYISANSVQQTSDNSAVAPLGLQTVTVGSGGEGLDDTGLLVKIWGQVTALGGNQYQVSDGSGNNVTVQMLTGSVSNGIYAAFTGVVSSQSTANGLTSLMLVSGTSNVGVY